MKNLILGLLLLASISSFAQRSDADMLLSADTIKNETAAGGNTKLRISNNFKYGILSKVSLLGSYSNPSWITGLAWSKISSTPTTLSSYGITDAVGLAGTQTITGQKTFTASGTTPGFFVGSYNGTPSGSLNGGMYYNTATNLMTVGYAGSVAGIVTSTQMTGVNNRIPWIGGTNSLYTTSGFTFNGTNFVTPNINGVTITGGSTPALTVTGTTSVSGSNTGDQTLNSLLPSQTSNSGKYLQTDGTNSSWQTATSTTGYTTTATAAGTTTLTVSSTFNQYFTGSTTQTVTMPVTSTLTLGQSFYIVNNSTGIVTVQSSGANTIQAMVANTTMMITCILTSGTGTASWNISYSISNPMTSAGDLIVGGSVSGGYANPTRLAIGTTNYVLTNVGGSVAWAAPGGVSGLTAGRVAVATSSTVIGDYDGLKWDDGGRSLTVGYNASGANSLVMGAPGVGLVVNNSSGEVKHTVAATYYPVFEENGSEKFRVQSGSFLIGTTTVDGSKLKVNGSLAVGYVAKTGAYTLTTSDYTVEVTSGTHSQTLPTAVGIPGRIYVITNSGSGTVTVATTSSQTFINVLTTPTTLTLTQFQTATVQSNGANWLKIAGL